MSTEETTQKPHYEPPEDKQVERFARAVCERFAQRQADETINSAEVVNGFAAFLKVILRIEAKHRNQSA